MIIVIYGINGAGKDMIAREVSRLQSNFVVVPQSKLLMYHLGLATSFTPKAELKADAYEKLEAVEEKTINLLGNTLCRDTVLELSASGKIVLCLSHLVVARFLREKYIYCKSTVSTWVRERSNGLVFIEADPEDILIWRKSDDRKRSDCLEEIIFQQKIARDQWEKLIDNIVPNIVIQNRPYKIHEAVRRLKNFIDKIK